METCHIRPVSTLKTGLWGVKDLVSAKRFMSQKTAYALQNNKTRRLPWRLKLFVTWKSIATCQTQIPFIFMQLQNP